MAKRGAYPGKRRGNFGGIRRGGSSRGQSYNQEEDWDDSDQFSSNTSMNQPLNSGPMQMTSPSTNYQSQLPNQNNTQVQTNGMISGLQYPQVNQYQPQQNQQNFEVPQKFYGYLQQNSQIPQGSITLNGNFHQQYQSHQQPTQNNSLPYSNITMSIPQQNPTGGMNNYQKPNQIQPSYPPIQNVNISNSQNYQNATQVQGLNQMQQINPSDVMQMTMVNIIQQLQQLQQQNQPNPSYPYSNQPQGPTNQWQQISNDLPPDQDPVFKQKLEFVIDNNIDFVLDLVMKKLNQFPKNFPPNQQLNPQIIPQEVRKSKPRSQASEPQPLEESPRIEKEKDSLSSASVENSKSKRKNQLAREPEDKGVSDPNCEVSRDSGLEGEEERIFKKLKKGRILCQLGKHCDKVGCRLTHTDSVCAIWQKCLHGNKCQHAHYNDFLRTLVEIYGEKKLKLNERLEQLDNMTAAQILDYRDTIKELRQKQDQNSRLAHPRDARDEEFHNKYETPMDKEFNFYEKEKEQIENIIEIYLRTVSKILLGKLIGKQAKFTDILQELYNESKCASKLLPIYSKKTEIMNFLESKVSNERFLVLSGETGTGKSTQLPIYILQHLHDNPHLGKAAIVQTRKIAAQALTARVCQELPPKLAGLVGIYSDPNTFANSEKKVLFMSDSQFIEELINKRKLEGYSVVVVDEAHERTIESDTVLGVLKKRVYEENSLPNLKVIVTSASINIDKFSAYLQNSSKLQIEGRQHPIIVKYQLPSHVIQHQGKDIADMIIKLLRYKKQILDDEDQFRQSNPEITWDLDVYKGHLIAFIPSKKEMNQLKALIAEEANREKKASIPKMHNFKILKFYSKMNYEKYLEIFEESDPEETTKVIFATKVAETSLTFSDVSMVIDAGSDRDSIYNPLRGFDEVRYMTISKSSALQRAGRAGRTGPGICYRIYSEEKYQNFMPESKTPEFLRRNIEKAILTLKLLGVDNIEKFDLLDKIPSKTIQSSEDRLVGYKALSAGKKIITDIGIKMCKIDVIPFFSSALFSAAKLGVFHEVAMIIGMLKHAATLYFVEEDPAILQLNREDLWDELSKKEGYEGAEGDHFLYLFIFQEFKARYEQAQSGDETEIKYRKNQPVSAAKKWCDEHRLVFTTLQNAYNTYKNMVKDFKGLDEQMELPNLKGTTSDRILQALLKSHLFNVCVYSNDESLGYLLARETTKLENVFIHSSSTYSGKSKRPPFIIFSELHDIGYLVAASVTGFSKKDFGKLSFSSKIKKYVEDLTKSIPSQLKPHTFHGLGSAVLSRFEDKMEEMHAWRSENKILFKTNEKTGSINIWVDPQAHDQIIGKIKHMLEMIKYELETEKYEIGVYKDTRVLFKKDAKLVNILKGNETTTLVARELDSSITAEDIEAAIKKTYGDIFDPQVRIYFDRKANIKCAVLFFDRPSKAEKLAENRLQINGLQIELKKQSSSHHAHYAEFSKETKVRVCWFSGSPQGQGDIYLNGMSDGKTIEHLLNGRTILGKPATATLYADRKKVALKNLPSVLDEFYLKEFLAKEYPRIHRQQICVYRNEYNPSTDGDAEKVERIEFEKYVSPIVQKHAGKFVDARFKQAESQSQQKFKCNYNYSFESLENAQNFIKEINEKQFVVPLPQGRRISKMIHAFPKTNVAFRVDKKLYKASQKEFEDCAVSLNTTYDKVARLVLPNNRDLNQPGSSCAIHVEPVIPIRDLKQYFENAIEIKEELSRISMGTQNSSLIDHQLYSLFFMEGREKNELLEIAENYGLHISTNPKTRALCIDGDPDRIKEAESAMKAYLDFNLGEYLVEDIDVTPYDANSLLAGGLEPLKNKYFRVHISLKIKKGSFSVECISKNKEALAKVKEEVLQSLVQEIKEDKTNCSLCNHKWIRGARILNCGHSYCSRCIRFYLQVLCRRKEHNWSCFRKDCKEGIIVRDIVDVLSREDLKEYFNTVRVQESRKKTDENVQKSMEDEVVMKEAVKEPVMKEALKEPDSFRIYDQPGEVVQVIDLQVEGFDESINENLFEGVV